MPQDPTLFVQQLLATIDEGRRTGTHKLLTILALLDACTQSDIIEEQAAELPVSRVADAAMRIAVSQQARVEVLDDPTIE